MRYIAISLFVLLAFQLDAQISIGSADMPSPGDTLRISQSINPNIYDFTETGENYVWDYSGLLPLKQSVDTFQSMTEMPYIYQITFYGAANLAHPLEGGPAGSDTIISNPYEFYDNTSSSYELAGGGFSMQDAPIPIKFDSPDKIFVFPLNYGNTYSSYSTYENAIPGFGYMGGWKQRDADVDGYGVLTTPFGTFDVLRVHAAVQQYDSIYFESQGFGFPVYQNYDEYYWLGEGQGIPLLYARQNTYGTASVTYRDSIRDLSVGIAEEKAMLAKIYPNPAHTIARIRTGDFQHIEITGLQGEVLFQSSDRSLLRGQDIVLDLEKLHLTQGIYFVRIRKNDTLSTLKLIIR